MCGPTVVVVVDEIIDPAAENATKQPCVASASKGLHITFKDVNVHVPDAERGFKQVITAIEGEALPGECLAIMGPTGSGKTTLLSCLAHTAPTTVKVQADISYGGNPWLKALKRRIAFVEQDSYSYVDMCR